MISLSKILLEDCWKGYKQDGMKKKGGKDVPNCIPESNEVEEALTPMQKLARKRSMAGKQRMIQRKRQRTALRKKGHKQLYKKAYKAAYRDVYEFFRMKLFPNVSKGDLSVIQKKLIEKWVAKKKRKVIKRAKFKYLPIFREKEIAKFKKEGVDESGKDKSEKNYADWKADNELDETAKRDYKAEYKKYQSSTKSKKYRAELNKYNRDKGTYGNGDGKDASHKGGKIVGFESESKNRGRAEKSRLKKESVNEGISKDDIKIEKSMTGFYNILVWNKGWQLFSEHRFEGMAKEVMKAMNSRKGMKYVEKLINKQNQKSSSEIIAKKSEKNGIARLIGESVNEGKVDRVVGHTKYKYVGDGRKGQAIVSGPMKDREKEAIIKRAKKAGYNAKPNMGGGVTIHVESLEVNEIGQFPINNYIQGIIPNGYLDTHTPQKKKQSVKLVSDLKKTLNNFWKSHDIPYRIK